MGTIPILQRNIPGYMPTVRQDASSATPDAFGASIGRGMQSFGGAVTSLGEMGMKYDEKKNAEAEVQRKEDERIQKEADGEAAKSALLSADSAANAEVTKFRTNEVGSNAKTKAGQIQQKVDDVFNSQLENLTPRQRDLVMPKMQAQRSAYELSINDHADREWSSHLTAQNAALIATAKDTAITRCYDDSTLAASEKEISDSVNSEARRLGQSPEEAQLKISKNKADLLAGVFSARLNKGDFGRAKEMLANRGDEFGDKREAAQKAFDTLQTQQEDAAKRVARDDYMGRLTSALSDVNSVQGSNLVSTYSLLDEGKKSGLITSEEHARYVSEVANLGNSVTNAMGQSELNRVEWDLSQEKQAGTLTQGKLDGYSAKVKSLLFPDPKDPAAPRLSQGDFGKAMTVIEGVYRTGGDIKDPLYGSDRGRWGLAAIDEAEKSGVLGNRILGPDPKDPTKTVDLTEQTYRDMWAKQFATQDEKGQWFGRDGDNKIELTEEQAKAHNAKASYSYQQFMNNAAAGRNNLTNDFKLWLADPKNANATESDVKKFIHDHTATARAVGVQRTALNVYLGKNPAAPSSAGSDVAPVKGSRGGSFGTAIGKNFLDNAKDSGL